MPHRCTPLSILLLLLQLLPAAVMADSTAFDSGMERYRQGDLKAARDHFSQALAAGDERATVYYNLAVTEYRMKDYDAAETHFLTAAQDSRWADLAAYNIGLIHTRRDKLLSARRWFGKVSEDSSVYRNARRMIARIDEEDIEDRFMDRVSGLLRIGLGHDDNVNRVPDTAPNDQSDSLRNLFANVGGDIGQDASWQLGVSRIYVNVEERSAGGHAHDHGGESPMFNGDSDLIALDAVWKTDLGGEMALIFQGEYFWRDEDGQVSLSEDAGDALFNYDGDQDGGYLQGVFQFNRQWRAGLRYDHLSADNDLTMISNTTGEADDDIFEESGYQSGSDDPHRWSAMVDWSPSEFSRLRLQYARDDSREDTDDQIYLQYIMTLGAHGAHQY